MGDYANSHEHIAIANLYYGHDPLAHKTQDTRYIGFELIGRRGGQRAYYNAISKWNVSYAAAYEAKFLAEQIKLMDARLAAHNKAIAEANAKAAAEAQARAQAEAERLAQEQARKAAEAEAKRAAEEQARIAQVAATVAAKQAHEAAMALWEAERWARIAERDAEEARRQAEVQKARKPDRATRTFPVSGSAAAAGPVFTIAGGSLAPNPVTASGIADELRSAVSAILEAVAATALPAVAGFATLVYPSELGNGERYALSVPLSEFVPDNANDLLAVAVSKGEIDLPVVLGSVTTNREMDFVVAGADGTSVPSSVPIRLATLAPHNNVYWLSRLRYEPQSPWLSNRSRQWQGRPWRVLARCSIHPSWRTVNYPSDMRSARHFPSSRRHITTTCMQSRRPTESLTCRYASLPKQQRTTSQKSW